jgi:hypothetical protein
MRAVIIVGVATDTRLATMTESQADGSLTVEQAQAKVDGERGKLGTIIRIAARGRVTFNWHHAERVYVVLKNRKVMHRGPVLADAVDAYNKTVAR